MITRILIATLALSIFVTAFADPADAQRQKKRTPAQTVEYIDPDLDGKVSRDEFVKGDRIFDLMDTDGIISQPSRNL